MSSETEEQNSSLYFILVSLSFNSYLENYRPISQMKLNVKCKQNISKSGTLWLRLWVSTAGGLGLIPAWGTKILHALWHSQKKLANQTQQGVKRITHCDQVGFSLRMQASSTSAN